MNIRKISLCLLAVLTTGLLIAFFMLPFSGDAAGNKSKPNAAKSQTSSPKPIGPPNYDAFAASQQRPDAKQRSAQLAVQTSGDGHLTQVESRLGVPTFLWASGQQEGQGEAKSLSANRSAQKNDIEGAARDHLRRYASNYRLQETDIVKAKLASIHNTGQGVIIAKFRQSIGGVEVFRDEINVIMNRDLQLVALSGYLTGDDTSESFSAQSFRLQPEDVVSKAVQDLTGTNLDTSVLSRVSGSTKQSEVKAGQEQDPYIKFSADNAALQNIKFGEDPARAKQVMFHMANGFVPAYYVEVNVLVPSNRTDEISLSGEAPMDELFYSYVVSAIDGQVLFRKNLVEEQLGPGGFTYRVWADAMTGIPYDSPAGNGVVPKLNATPDGQQFPFVAPNDVTLPNFPFSQNDPWLAPGATETTGNNVDAYVDLFNPDGFSPAGTPADPATADFRAQITGAGQFLHTHTPDASPTTAEARQASLQQLFYDTNFLHDWFYDAGFDEASGNAQTNNFGRGGLQNDRLKAEGQDVSGRNNANMTTPADGTSPRMQMFLFDANAIKYVDVLSPAAAAGQRTNVGTAQFGQQVFDATNPIFQPSPAGGCTAASFTGASGKFVMVDREPTSGTGFCSIGTKLNNAMAAGAAGFILVNLSTAPTQAVNVTGSLPTFTIPFLSITWNDAASIKTQLAASQTVTARMRRDASVDRDGTIDNQVIAHEWGHYISNRLIGNGAGLVTQQSGGMGEGWGDFTAMLMTVRPDDVSVPSNATWNGIYALATYVSSGGANNGYYFGIRRYPYSTDIVNKNPLTLKYIANGNPLPVGPPVLSGADGSNNAEVHNTGEVWATMLWECYAALLRDTQGAAPRLSFQQAQDRMKRYLVSAYKMTPSQPTFLEARDAVLASAYANDPVDYNLFLQAFAKRGAGVGAVIPDRYTLDNNPVTESFAVTSEAVFTGATLDDSVSSCDADGVLDTGEVGRLTINLKNVGIAPLTGTTATVTSTTPGVTVLNGGTVNFASYNPTKTGTASVVVALAPQLAGVRALDFNISYSDPNLAGSPRNVGVSFRGNTDSIPSSTATDTVETTPDQFTPTSVPPVVISGGYPFYLGVSAPWKVKQVSALQHVWHIDDVGAVVDERLTSPTFTVDGSGSFNLQFDHSWSFEFDSGGNYDGGVIEISINGGAFSDFGAPAYNGVILNYGNATSNANPIKGRNGFVQNSSGTVHTSLTQAVAPGSTVQIRFRVGSDPGFGAAGWDIDNLAFTGVMETPFSTLVAETGACSTGPVTSIDITNVISPQRAGVPFPITVLAKDASNNTVSNFTGTVNLTTTAGTINPTTSAAFVNGVLYQNVSVTQAGTNKVISVDDGNGHNDTSNLFTVNSGPLDHFTIGSISSPQVAGAPFNVMFTAVDAFGNSAADFTGTVNMSTTAGTISPATSGAFVSGARTESVSVSQSGTNKTISISDGNGHNAVSNNFNVVDMSDLSVTKVDTPDPVTAGNNLTYTITAANAGPSPASSVNLSDTLPAGTTFISLSSPGGWSCTTPAVGAGGAISCTNSTLASGGSAMFTLTAAVTASTATGTIISNTATIASTTTDPTPGNNSATATTTVNTSADLSITKTDTPDPAAAGTNLTYTITAANAGPSNAASASVSDTLPAGTTFVSLSSPGGWSCTTPAVGAGGAISCTMSSFGVTNAVFTLVVKIDANTASGTVISNTATTTATTTDPTPGNNSATTTTTVSSPATVTGTKTVSGAFTVGGTVTYTITLSNSGPSKQQDNPGNEFTDVLPAGLTLVSSTATAGTSVASIGTNTVTWNGSIAAAGSVTITITATVNAGTGGQTISNQGTISYDADGNGTNEASAVTDDPVTGAANDPTSFTVVNLSDLSVTKTAAPNPVIAGNNIVYTINVVNSGPGSASAATLTDVLPANTTFQSITALGGWSCTTPAVNSTGTVTCIAGSLANGASASFTLVVNVNTGTANGAVTNTANVSSAVPDPTAANNSASTTIAVSEYTSPAPTGLAPKAMLVKPAAGNTTAGGGVSDSSCVAPTGVTVAGVFANINQALGAANVGDTIYVCPKYSAGVVVPYVEHVSLGFTNLSVVGISDAKGSRAVIAANPSTATSPTTQLGTNYIVQIVATGVNFGNFVIDGAPVGTNFTGTGIFNGIVVRRSGAFVFNNTVQNIRTSDTDANSDGQGIAVFGAGSANSPLEAGTTASPVNILNNVVQKFRSNGVNVSSGSSSAYAFVRGNYVIGNSNDTVVIAQNLSAQGNSAAGKSFSGGEAEVNLLAPVATVAQTGVHFETGANGDIFNNRISSFIFPNQAPCIPGPALREGEQTNIIIPCIPVPTANAVGIRLDTTGSTSANPLRVRFNSISKTQMGIFGQNVQYVNIASNTITGSDVDGIHLQGSAVNFGSNFNTVTTNSIFSSRRAGLFLGIPTGDASLGNVVTTNTVVDAYFGMEDFTPVGNNTVQLTGATANTFISVNRTIGNDGSGGSIINQLP